MAKQTKLNPFAATLGAAVVASAMSVPAVQAAENPFGATDLASGYQLAGNHGKDAEGKCGEGKCGEGSCGEKSTEGSCGGDKSSEGSCGGQG